MAFMNKDENSGSEKGRITNKDDWNIRPYLAVGLTIIIVFFICLAGFFFIYRFDGVSDGIGKAFSSIRAVVIGLVLAYLLTPIMKFFERNLNKVMFKKSEKTLKQKRIIRGLSVTITVLVFLAAIALLLMAIVPSLVKSIEELVMTMNDKIQTLNDWINRVSKNEDGMLVTNLHELVGKGSDKLVEWLKVTFLGNSGDIIESVTKGVYNAVKLVFSAVVGLIISVYVMMRKEVFVAQGKKIVFAVFKPRIGNYVMEVVHKADEVFGGFFIGKIIDSIIIGFICFGCMYLLKMPYVVLISVIVGVTNIIPFFGPYVGAIPCVILIFLVNPLQSLYFIIFIIILQQFDGNILGPKILSNTTGLSPFWVIFSVLAFGGAWGVVGMIVGVPVFAVIYYVVKRVVEHLLKKRKLPENTNRYVEVGSVDLKTNELKKRSEKQPVIQPPKRKKKQTEE